MSIIQMDLPSLLKDIQQDNTKKRFNAKIFLINNLSDYFYLVEKLEDMADLSIHLSDDSICTGDDTVPNLKAILPMLDSAADKNVLITSVGEYLRFGMAVEKINRCLFSIIGHQAHSEKRVWLPIFAAKEEFLSAVGELDDEHYPQMVYEVEGVPSEFEITVYARNLVKVSGADSAVGLKAWLELWDSRTVKSGMSCFTRHAKQLRESDGIYTVTVFTEPFRYFKSRISEEGGIIDQSLGTDMQWLNLAAYAAKPGMAIREVIEQALNLRSFDPHQVLSRWNSSNENTRWLFWLWYKLGLNSASDYISKATENASSWNDVPACIERTILKCFDNPNLDEWILQRNEALEELGFQGNSSAFWDEFNAMNDARKKIKLLSGRTHDERTKIIEMISAALKNGSQISDYKTLLEEKYPDLFGYLSESQYLPEDLKAYIKNYKYYKIKDVFSREFSDSAELINFYEFDTRGQILNKIKNARSAYYIWIDGMGIEWLDLLVKKIGEESGELTDPAVFIGAAVLPTITSVNMTCADSETVSCKLGNLDSLGHVKDRSDCNYYSIIAKQLELIGTIAHEIVRIASKYPQMDIVITADHGMSRMAAKGFHSIDGVKAPKAGTVYSLGRYCVFPAMAATPEISHTVRQEQMVAFRTHAHFSVSGYAPGEIHGGATPEEILVPVIHYRREHINGTGSEQCSYELEPSVVMSSSGVCKLHIKTQGAVGKVTVEIQSKRIIAQKSTSNEWVVQLENLSINQSYTLRVYLNNIYTDKEERIYVKAAGLTINDDF